MAKRPGPHDVTPIPLPGVQRQPRVTADDFGAGVIEAGASLASQAVSSFRSSLRSLQPAEDGAFLASVEAEGQRRFGRMVVDHRNKAVEGDDYIGFLGSAFETEANSIIDEQRRSGARPSAGALDEARRRLDRAQVAPLGRAGILESRLRGQRLTNDLDGALMTHSLCVFDEPNDLDQALGTARGVLEGFKGILADDVLEARRTALPDQLGRAAARGMINVDPGGAVEAIEAGRLDKYLDEDARTLFTGHARAEFDQDLAEARAAEAGLGARAVTLLETGITAGTRGRVEIAEAFSGGFIGAAERDRLTAFDAIHRKSRARRADLVRAVASVAGGHDNEGFTFDADDPEHADALDAFWRDDARPVFEGGDAKTNAQEFTRIMVQITSRLGAVPNALVNELRAGGLSGEPAEEVAAAGRIKALRDEGFELREIPRDERQRAELIDEFAGIGLKPERAVELAEERIASRRPIPAAPPPDAVRDKFLHGDEEPSQIDDLVHRPHMVTDPDGTVRPETPDEEHRRTAMPLVERPGFVWENGEWRRETPDDVRNQFQLKSSEAGGEGGGGGADSGDDQNPGMVGPGGEGKPDENAPDRGTGEEPDDDGIQLLKGEGGGVFVIDTKTGRKKEIRSQDLDDLSAWERDLRPIGILDEGGAADLETVPDEQAEAVGEFVLSLLPGIGEAMSARDAYHAFLAAQDAVEKGDLSDAAIEASFVALGVMGAIPGVGKLVQPVRAIAKLLRRQGRRAKETAAIAGRSTSQAWYGRWADNILSGKTQPQGKMARVGTMSAKVRAFVKKRGLDAGDGDIAAIDRRIRRMRRDAKPADQKLTEEIIRRMPEDLAKPRAVLWDRKKGKLSYVFDVPGDRKGKYIVNVDVVRKLQRGDKIVEQRGNFTASGGRVQRDALTDSNTYDLVEGKL